MTKSTKGPDDVPGGNDENDDRNDAKGYGATRDQPAVETGRQGKQSSECSTKGGPGAGSRSMRSGGDASTQGGSRSEVGHDAKSASGECCEPKSAPLVAGHSAPGSQACERSDTRRYGNDGAGALPFQTDENRSRHGQPSVYDPSRSEGGSASPERGPSNRPVSSNEPRTDRPDRVGPRAPQEFDPHVPVQPKRAEPAQPSRFTDPPTGCCGADGYSEAS